MKHQREEPIDDLSTAAEPLPWEAPTWLAEVTAWIHAQLAHHGRVATGPVELIHQRAWSSFAQIATDQGRLYFKAPAPAFQFEAGLTAALAQWQPAVTVPVLAVDQARGWILTADAGPTLRQAAPTAPEQIDHWVALLPRYAELQMAMTTHTPALLALGMPDRRLTVLPGLYRALLGETAALRIGLDQGLTPAEYQNLQAIQAQFPGWCAELASDGLPATLTHEEVHDANVLVNDGHYYFVDWSDSSVAHPFFSILVTLRAAAYRLKLPEDGPEITRLRDSYLEPWSRFCTPTQLRESYKLAYHLGMVNRALSWHEAIRKLAMQHKAPYLDTVPGWLQDFVAASKGQSPNA